MTMFSSPRRTRAVVAVSAGALALGLAACSSSSSSGGSTGGSGKIGVSLITKDSTNPFFVAMQNGAKDAASKAGNIDLTIASGAKDGDEAGQVTAIENAVTKGDKGILITPNGPGVNASLTKARAAGLYVIALDTPPDPASTVDITFATDNFKAGKLIGQWAKTQLAGKPATIALLDLFNDKVVSVDYNRDQGFLTGMGIPVNDPKKNADEAKTGNYAGGTYTIVCNEPTQGAEDGGRTAMENCLTKNPNINVVYTINEPAAVGANAALKAAGKSGPAGSTCGSAVPLAGQAPLPDLAPLPEMAAPPECSMTSKTPGARTYGDLLAPAPALDMAVLHQGENVLGQFGAPAPAPGMAVPYQGAARSITCKPTPTRT